MKRKEGITDYLRESIANEIGALAPNHDIVTALRHKLRG